VSFAVDAYLNELGISTQSCYKGTSILAFATDNQSNNVTPEGGLQQRRSRARAPGRRPAGPAVHR
jgi:hypothetical protein